MSEIRRGTLFGAAAYLAWGVFPLYFPLLKPAGALEVLAHRVVWSLLVVAVLVWMTRRAAGVQAVFADRRRLLMLSTAAVLLAVNWGVYIYGVTSGQVVEASLGYFVNPLVTVLLGVFVLGERLRRPQWVAVGIAAVAVLVLTVENGRPPWIALALAVTFGTYGLLKKTAGVGAVEGLTVETAVLAPVALLFLIVLQVRGDATFTAHGPGHAALLATTGLVTAIPLLFFGAAASRVPLTTLGVLQYVTPVMQFLLGVLVFHEPLGLPRFLGFVLVWIALCLFTVDLVRSQRRDARLLVTEPV
ncbi:MAG: putative superfamily transporter inner rane protein [Frankiales bacterium]|nr:putative superfamily transporter inner rane protein [Frankiales bacterium]